ncbi:MAG: hypothetical protein N3D84_03325 [Candidatus Woesearchaeota archaeon]|nr:hypothetical protein [Candidatus Woesearchaeota archaeon]
MVLMFLAVFFISGCKTEEDIAGEADGATTLSEQATYLNFNFLLFI